MCKYCTVINSMKSKGVVVDMCEPLFKDTVKGVHYVIAIASDTNTGKKQWRLLAGSVGNVTQLSIEATIDFYPKCGRKLGSELSLKEQFEALKNGVRR